MSQLDQADRDAVTVGHRGLLDRSPSLVRSHASGRLTGEAQMQRRPETRILEQLPHRLGGQTQRNLGRPHIGRLLDHLGNRQQTFRVRIMDRGRADGERSG